MKKKIIIGIVGLFLIGMVVAQGLIDIRLGDVRRLPFYDNYFAGYWSLGVIEHFWEGYKVIALEMVRVIKNNGYLFLAFPCMNPLRRVKAWLGLYPAWEDTNPLDNFYQFALNSKTVIRDFEGIGFTLVTSLPLGEIDGAKNELSWIRFLLQKLYDYKGNNIAINLIQKVTSKLLTPIASHSVILILKKSAY